MGLRIGIDMDSCVYPFVDVFADYCAKKTGRPRGSFPTPVKSWDFPTLEWGLDEPGWFELLREGIDSGYIFCEGAPIPGSLEALQTFRNEGHTIHIATDRFTGKYAVANTQQWLQDWLVPYDSLTFTPDKTIVKADVFIDDRPRNVRALRQAGCKAFMLNWGRSDQADFPPQWTVNDWNEFMCIVHLIECGRANGFALL